MKRGILEEGTGIALVAVYWWALIIVVACIAILGLAMQIRRLRRAEPGSSGRSIARVYLSFCVVALVAAAWITVSALRLQGMLPWL